jgi:hypothetical protein
MSPLLKMPNKVIIYSQELPIGVHDALGPWLPLVPVVYVFAGQQLDLAFDTITNPDFIRKSLGVVIALVAVHVVLLVLLLRIQLKPRPLTRSYLEAVQKSVAFGEIGKYLLDIKKPKSEGQMSELGKTRVAFGGRAAKLGPRGDVVRELFAHRLDKLRRNRITRVMGFNIRFRKSKIVSAEGPRSV